jgi:hypothetical protein
VSALINASGAMQRVVGYDGVTLFHAFPVVVHMCKTEGMAKFMNQNTIEAKLHFCILKHHNSTTPVYSSVEASATCKASWQLCEDFFSDHHK